MNPHQNIIVDTLRRLETTATAESMRGIVDIAAANKTDAEILSVVAQAFYRLRERASKKEIAVSKEDVQAEIRRFAALVADPRVLPMILMDDKNTPSSRYSLRMAFIQLDQTASIKSPRIGGPFMLSKIFLTAEKAIAAYNMMQKNNANNAVPVDFSASPAPEDF